MIWWLYLHLRYTWHYGWRFTKPRNGRVAHQPVNGTIPSELVQLFCKIVNGVLRIFGRDGNRAGRIPSITSGWTLLPPKTQRWNKFYRDSIDWQVSWNICRIWKLKVYNHPFSCVLFFQGIWRTGPSVPGNQNLRSVTSIPSTGWASRCVESSWAFQHNKNAKTLRFKYLANVVSIWNLISSWVI